MESPFLSRATYWNPIRQQPPSPHPRGLGEEERNNHVQHRAFTNAFTTMQWRCPWKRWPPEHAEKADSPEDAVRVEHEYQGRTPPQSQIGKYGLAHAAIESRPREENSPWIEKKDEFNHRRS